MNEGFAMLQFMGPMMLVVSLLVWLVVIGPLLLYPVARWKQNREGVADPQLGIKVTIHYFKLLAFQTLLAGGVVLLWTIVNKMSEKGDLYRMAFGFLVPGGLVYGVHHVMVARTNNAMFPNVQRLFIGYNLLTTGLVGFGALLAGFQALFAKGSSGDVGRLFMAAIFVYCGAWAALAVRFGKLVLEPSSGSMMPPSNMMPPGGMQPPGANQSGGALPPLSAGQYPPIPPRG
jgi:hypothetical protein